MFAIRMRKSAKATALDNDDDDDDDELLSRIVKSLDLFNDLMKKNS